MRLTPRQRPIVLGIALAGTAVLASGATATVVTRAAVDGHPQAQNVVSQVRSGSTPAPDTSPTTPATAKPHPARVAPVAGTRRPITVSQAVAVATGRTHARFEKVEAEYGPQGLVYEVKLVRSNGADVEVLVLARTGGVISVHQEPVDVD